jgi:hypothetical protein
MSYPVSLRTILIPPHDRTLLYANYTPGLMNLVGPWNIKVLGHAVITCWTIHLLRGLSLHNWSSRLDTLLSWICRRSWCSRRSKGSLSQWAFLLRLLLCDVLIAAGELPCTRKSAAADERVVGGHVFRDVVIENEKVVFIVEAFVYVILVTVISRVIVRVIGTGCHRLPIETTGDDMTAAVLGDDF